MSKLAQRTRRVCLKHEPYDVFMGRRAWVPVGYTDEGYTGEWGNYTHGVEEHREWFLLRVAQEPHYAERVQRLKGKRLGCFCAPGKPCHVDVIVAWLEGEIGEDAPTEADLLRSMAERLGGSDAG